MKPTKAQKAAFEAWFERLILDMKLEIGIEDTTIALANVGEYQVQLKVTRHEFDFLDKIQTAGDAND